VNKQEIAAVVAKIKLGDNREVNELVLAEWFDTIGHLEFEDAVAAVTMHRQESIDYLTGAHLIRNVRRIREDRAAHRKDELHVSQWVGPKPENLAELIAAHRSGEPHAVALERAKYNRQLVDAGYPLQAPEWGVAGD
jgi:hypothetical protein